MTPNDETPTLKAFQAIVGEWADRTFPGSDWRSITEHMREELDELQNALYRDDDGRGWYEREAGGLLLLLLHLAHKEQFDLLGCAMEEHKANTTSVWETDDQGRGYRKRVVGKTPEELLRSRCVFGGEALNDDEPLAMCVERLREMDRVNAETKRSPEDDRLSMRNVQTGDGGI